ncbi:hypothetical protein QWY31_04085 [Cytophagales bacterium LB-30]|uniref:Porin family protein n=1 Tax=Shiella aurantiaca TaxID=3058365 RepID=A0ABT8F369_9BACT|nr:hypothetical protein [Shiella aurantiaca]MDN4164666.1 hypothetical protein [Shiella aurantiaca]
MKKILLLVCGLISLPYWASAQFVQGYDKENSTFEREPEYRFLLGAGLAINDYGIGLTGELPIQDQYGVYGNLGVGGWGSKIGLGGIFYFDEVIRGGAIQLGFASASGLRDYELEMEVQGNTTELVTMDLFRANTLNAQYVHSIALGRNAKLCFQIGRAWSVTRNAYRVTSGHTLSPASEALLEFLKPGGWIVGTRLMFSL